MINPDTPEVFSLSAASLALLEAHTKCNPECNAIEENATISMKPAKISIGDKKHVAVINSYKARNIAHKAQAQRVHRNLQLAKHTVHATIVCPDTGIVSILEIPAIPGCVLEYNHPLSDLSNARGLAQQGIAYLRKLDTQVLAGILIVLASDYSLFIYQPADSGAQKNAILRTVQKDTLIQSILTIEDMVHSSNHSYLPKLSLIMDTEVDQGGIENRMQAWLKLIVAAIYTPDTEVWDENATIQRTLKLEAKKQKTIRLSEESADRKAQKILKDDCKLAIGIIKDLYKQETISSKLRIFLGGVFQEYQLVTMEASARILLTGKLQDIGNINSAKLSEILNRNRGNLVAKNSPLDDFFSDDTEAPPVRVIVEKTETTVQEIRVLSIEVAAPEVEADQQRISISGKDFVVSTAFYATLSFIGKVKYHKALLAGTTQEVTA